MVDKQLLLSFLLFTRTCPQSTFGRGLEGAPNEILNRIGNGHFSLNDGNWDTVSDATKDFVSKMLHVDPLQRLSAISGSSDTAGLSREKTTQQPSATSGP